MDLTASYHQHRRKENSMKINKMTFPWGETFKDVQVSVVQYTDRSTALVLFTEWDGNLATPSVNLSGYGMHPRDGHVFIRGDAEGRGLLDLLVEHGIVESTDNVVNFGPFDSWAIEARLLVGGAA